MSWLRPLAFWALVPLLPLLWWALWRMRRPAHWIWPSLLLWERVAAQHPELLRTARTERPPWEAWVWSHLAVAALVAAAAGPALPGPARLRAGLVLDHSPSTAARAREGGTRRQRIEVLAARLAALLAPQDRLERLVVTASGDAALRDGALALRARGCDPVVAIADHTLARPWRAPPRWLALVAASPAGANAALLGAGLRQTEGGAWLLVRVAGAGTRIAALACEVRAGERTLLQRRLPAAPVARPHVLLAPLGVSVTAALTVRVRPLGADGQPIADALAADDALVLWPGSAGPAVHVRGGPAALAPPLRAAFEALGVRWVVRPEEAELEVRIGDGPRGAPPDRPQLWLCERPGAGPPVERLWVTPNPILQHTSLRGLRFRHAPAAPPPGLRALVIDDRGRPVVGWIDGRGTVPVAWIGLPLGAPELAARWARHPSLPVLLAELVEGLLGRRLGDPVRYREAAVAPVESAQAVSGTASVAPIARARALLAEARAAARERAPRDLTPVAAALAALALLVAWWRSGPAR